MTACTYDDRNYAEHASSVRICFHLYVCADAKPGGYPMICLAPEGEVVGQHVW